MIEETGVPSFTDAELRAAYTNQRDFWGDPESPAEQILIEAYTFPEVDEDQDTLLAVVVQLARSQPEPYTLDDLRKMSDQLTANYASWVEIGDEYLTDQLGEALLSQHSSRIDVEGIGRDVARDQMHLYLEVDGRIYKFSG